MLATKEGNKEVEELIGVKIDKKFNTLQYGDLPLPGEPLVKEKTYLEKKKEQEDHDRALQRKTNKLLKRIHKVENARELKKTQEKQMMEETERKLQILRNKKKEELDKFDLEEKRRRIAEDI